MYYDESIEINFKIPDFLKGIIDVLIKARKEKKNKQNSKNVKKSRKLK